MKPIKTSFHLIAIALLLFTGSCSDKVKDTITYTANIPVYQTRTDFIKTVQTGAFQALANPGKIYLHGNYIFINELYKGIHVIDNTTPANPKNIAFINIPGNVDIAVKGNTLYADSFTDLVALDITDPTKATEINRVDDAFPNVMPPTNNNFPVTGLDATQGIVVGWTQKKVTEDYSTPVYWVGPMGLSTATYYSKDNSSWSTAASGISGQSAIAGTGTSGQSAVAGSMARFAVYNDILYALTNSQMKIFSIANTQMILLNSQWTSWQAQTLFISGQLMFAGTRQGLIIFNLSNPSIPAQVSSFSHAYSCDPVVVEGNYAYYTMLSGNSCGQTSSGLGIVDITDPTKPVEINFIAMTSPYGLGIDNKRLFLCNGYNGLVVYNVANPAAILSNQLASFNNIQAYDVIPYNNILMVIGKGGLMQYDYTDITNIKLLSTITTSPKAI
jgi:hypothetical protein